MPRIPYKPADINQPEEIVNAIHARRNGNLLNLDRMLLHSPALARGWNAFLGEVRNNLELPPKLRELTMCVVAILNGADYEFYHHAPEFINAGGTAEQVEALRNLETSDHDVSGFNAAEQAVIELTTEITLNIHVSDALFSTVRSALHSEQLMVELVGVIAAYNMVSRFLVALEVEPE